MAASRIFGVAHASAFVTWIVACVLALQACIMNVPMLTTPPVLAPSRSIVIDGVRINYDISGTEIGSDKPVLVLVHGFAASLETWVDVYPALSAEYTVVRLDLKGFGFSAKPNDHRYHVADQAELLTKFIQKMSFRRVVLVGHSYGGAVVLLSYFNLRSRPNLSQVVGIVLIDSAGYRQRYPFQVDAYRNPLVRFVSFNFTSPAWRSEYALRKIFVDDSRITPDRIYRYAFFLDLPGSQRAFTQVAEQISQEDSDNLVLQLPTISVPTLLIWGEQDPVIPVEHSKLFASAIPGAQLRIIPQSGHVPHEERPGATLSILFPFLQQINAS